MPGAPVALRDVHKRYGATPVVNGVSLDVAGGEFLVLVGPSGCGKSTLLRTIAGLEDITSGTITIDDRVVNDVPPKDRNIGMVFQSYALYPHMTVRDNLGFGLKLRKAPQQEIAARVDEAAKMLVLEPLLDRLPKNLSGGQRQRVAMGRAIVRRPRVFLFDEPLSNLDAALRVQMRAEIAALHRRLGTTMIYVTHDQVEAMTLATRIAVLHQGVLQQVGPALELYQRPVNRFVAGFIGSPAMSFIDGLVESDKFSAGALSIPLANVGGRAAIGLRPQSMRLAEPGQGSLRGVVEVVEPMGWETYVHVVTDHGRLVVHQAGASPVNGGDAVGVTFDAKDAHVFDADDRAVRHPAA